MRLSLTLFALLILGSGVVPANASTAAPVINHKPHKVKKHKAVKHHPITHS